MKVLAASVVLWGCCLITPAPAGVTVYFSPSQSAEFNNAGTTSDTIRSGGYVFTCTRDKLFTGGLGTNAIGRGIRVAWPAGLEAQYVTAGPQTAKASITIQRQDGAVFDIVSFTAQLLANAGAGRAIEIVPKIQGEEPLNDPLFFDVSGNYGSRFSYDRSANPWGSTAALTNYDTYILNLTLDYALVALELESAANSAPSGLDLSPASVAENEPVGTVVGTFFTSDPDPADTFTYSLVAGPGGEDNGAFSLAGADLRSEASFNFEAKSEYSIRVRVTDQGGLWTEQTVAIGILDVDEPAPRMDAPRITPDGQAVLTWSSLPNHVYAIHCSTNLATGFVPLITNLPATPPLNTWTDAVPGVAAKFWRVSTSP